MLQYAANSAQSSSPATFRLFPKIYSHIPSFPQDLLPHSVFSPRFTATFRLFPKIYCHIPSFPQDLLPHSVFSPRFTATFRLFPKIYCHIPSFPQDLLPHSVFSPRFTATFRLFPKIYCHIPSFPQDLLPHSVFSPRFTATFRLFPKIYCHIPSFPQDLLPHFPPGQPNLKLSFNLKHVLPAVVSTNHRQPHCFPIPIHHHPEDNFWVKIKRSLLQSLETNIRMTCFKMAPVEFIRIEEYISHNIKYGSHNIQASIYYCLL